ncbi:MAG: acetyltransferase-like isoleucine patch superfamily enzyme [Sulfurimonas sp.]|jgi:acetyltransferase-like isoleucine patch superfamily enzyme|uniref:acyltransferase n=1 Tax=Sulfurimonas sp. TaxID=2022749 RepID=UPI0039E56302
MNKFTFIQKLRNKIRIKGSLDLDIAKNAKLANCTIRSKGSNNKLVIEDGTSLRYTELEILGDNCSILIGKNCGIGHNSYLSAKEGRTLLIKDNCSLSRNVKIMTSDGHPIYQKDKVINAGRDITLEANVWIADNVTILKGVTVGHDSIVGINSTLTKTIGSNVIAVGNPASVVKEGICWED